MNDDGIFRNERPHEVVMPEGSHIAVSKSAEKTEPSVRKVFQEGEEFIDANLILEEGAGTAIRSSDVAIAVTNSESTHIASSSEVFRIDHQNAEASLLREGKAIAASEDSLNVVPPVAETKLNKSEITPQTISPSVDTQKIGESVNISMAMPEMDFPARVINLKIENDQLHERLDLLEQRNVP